MEQAVPRLTTEDLAPLFKDSGASDEERWEALERPALRRVIRGVVVYRMQHAKMTNHELHEAVFRLQVDLWKKAIAEKLPRPGVPAEPLEKPSGWLWSVTNRLADDAYRREHAQKRGGAGRSGEGQAARYVQPTEMNPNPVENIASQGLTSGSRLVLREEPDPERRFRVREQLQRALRFVLAPDQNPGHRVAWLLYRAPPPLQEEHFEQAYAVPNRARGGAKAGLVRQPAEAWKLFGLRCHARPGRSLEENLERCPEWEAADIAWLMRSVHPGPAEAWSEEAPRDAKKAVGTVQKWVRRLDVRLRRPAGMGVHEPST